MVKKLSIGLSIFFHLFIFFCFSFFIISPIAKTDEKKPGLYIPSYVYKYHPETNSNLTQKETFKKPIDKLGIEKTKPQAIQFSNHPEVVNLNIGKKTEPVNLIGDKSIDRPLLTLLGKALTAHLIYPKSAVDLNVRGIVFVGFTLHPDGQVTDIKLMQTSRAGVLDASALSAVNAISPVKNVNLYLQQTKFLVVGVIFG